MRKHNKQNMKVFNNCAGRQVDVDTHEQNKNNYIC